MKKYSHTGLTSQRRCDKIKMSFGQTTHLSLLLTSKAKRPSHHPPWRSFCLPGNCTHIAYPFPCETGFFILQLRYERRCSRTDGYSMDAEELIEQLEDMKETAPDDMSRREIGKLIDKMRNA